MNYNCPSSKVGKVLNEISGLLQELDPASINSDTPIASGILDVFEGVDNVMDKLSAETKQVLADVELSEPEFSEDMNAMLDDFVNIYALLGPEFDPAAADPISFSRGVQDLGKRRTLLTAFDLLEGL